MNQENLEEPLQLMGRAEETPQGQYPSSASAPGPGTFESAMLPTASSNTVPSYPVPVNHCHPGWRPWPTG